MRRAYLAPAALLCLAVIVSTPAPAAEPMRGDPSFRAESLTPEQRTWYDRLLQSIEDSRSTVESRASSRDLYYTGRTVGDYNAALLVAFRVTGDLGLLDRVAEISELYRAQLADEWLDGTTDGYLSWVWLIEPANETYYGNDLHQADEVIMHGNVALVACALHQNRDLDPSYGEKADFWRDYLETHFLAKWYERSGADPVTAWDATESQSGNALYRRYVVTRANQLRLAYYLWRMTEDDFYLDRARSCAVDLVEHMELNPSVPTAYRWKHQISGSDLGWQKINYAQYFLRVVQEMHLESFEAFGGVEMMQTFASTFADVVLPGIGAPYSQMTERVDGSGATNMRLYNLAGFGRWDESGFILERAEENYEDGLDGVSTAAFALMAVTESGVSSVGDDGGGRGAEDGDSGDGSEPGSDGSDSDPGGGAPGAAGPGMHVRWGLASANPTFGPVAVRLELGSPSRVGVELYHVGGGRVATVLDDVLPRGAHEVMADLRQIGRLATGVYYVMLRGPGFAEGRRVTFLR